MRSVAVNRNGWPQFYDPLTRHAVWSGSAVQVSTVRWARDEHPADFSGQARLPTFVMVRHGSYVKRVGKALGVGDPNHVAYSNPADEFRNLHPSGLLTIGTTFRIRAEVLDPLLAELHPRGRRDLARPFPVLIRPISGAACALHHGILAHLAEPGPKDALFVEETLIALARHMVANAYRGRTWDRCSLSRQRLRGRIPELQVYLNAEHTRELQFQELVDWMGCSPWHLSRVFAEETGVPLYRYLRRVRVRFALGRLLEGATSLLDVALEAGFASHSRFTRAFQEEFGELPSRLRDRASVERIRELVGRLEQV